MDKIRLIKGDCLEVMDKLIEDGVKIDTVLISPPYNISVKKGEAYALKYRGYSDCMPNDKYIEWLLSIFNKIDTILSKDGVILWNMNYGTNNNETLWLFLAELINKTSFTIADNIVWKKKSAFPNNCSPNKITRITENVFVICRKSEYNTFRMNKKVVSVRKTGQKMYENVFGFIEADNNDRKIDKAGHNATFSTDLCNQLLTMYGFGTVFDPFMGIGTSAVSSEKMGFNYIGCEIADKYFSILEKRIKDAENDRKSQLFTL